MAKRPEQLRLTMPEPLEWDLQQQIADALRLELGPPLRLSPQGVTWIAYDAADSGSSVPAARIARGIVAGMPDLLFLYRGRAYAQEVKRVKLGVLSDDQKLAIAALRLAGVEVALCHDAESCVRNLDVWQIPRRRRLIMSPLKETEVA